MSAIKTLNPQAEVARAHAALQININAALGLQEVLRTNLGPKGTIKMYVFSFNLIQLPAGPGFLCPVDPVCIQPPVLGQKPETGRTREDIRDF